MFASARFCRLSPVFNLRHHRFLFPLGSLVLGILVGCGAPVPATNGNAGAKGTSSSGGSSGGAGSSGGSGGGAGIIFTAPPAVDGGPAAVCGNGVLEGVEQCDDGNAAGGDGCSKLCQVENNFECKAPGQPCINLAVCGNAVLTSNEACDDGNTVPGDGCSADCQTIEPGWQCRVPGKPCTAKCGDGVLSGAESCDDGNDKNGDGCSVTCKLEPGYKCSGSKCVATTCGDGVREGTESCDDGNTMPFDGCSQDCQNEPDCSGASCVSKCGDGILLDEKCDDGNGASGDGCSSTCTVEPGWDCKQPPLGDKMVVPAIFRDFRFHNPSDFESDLPGGSGAVTGIVDDTLDKDGKPVFTGSTDTGVAIESKATFATWYRTTDKVNHATASKLSLWKTSKGSYVNRYGENGEQWKNGIDGNPLFFPVDNDTFTPASELAAAQIPALYDSNVPYETPAKKHNFSFTSEVRYWFSYESGKTYQLDFVGDDDFWVFINKKLAVDIGGLHSPAEGSITLNATWATKLGNLQSGKVYEIAVFHAERHTTASTFKLTLNGFNAATTICTPTCGDGVAVANEECDNGKDNNDTAYGGCTTKCKWGTFCGDGMVNGPEECDNGKKNGIQYGKDGCTFGCTRPHFCGDNRLDADRGEECDMGAQNGVPDESGQVLCSKDCRARIL
jgi:fibro-slime domain-containing protein